MKKIKFSILSVFIFSSVFSQNYNSFVDSLIAKTNLDTLVSYVRILTGEDSVIIGNSNILIHHRISNLNNDTAAEYVKQKFINYGLTTFDQAYSSSGRNIYAVQTGVVNPNKKYIICAHYDASTYYCADDDASGVAAVLEAARILSQYSFENTIIYALWDEEEVGVIGSKYFADSIALFGNNIFGVVNLEMFGWDSNNDKKISISTSTAANSPNLANTIANINSLYNLTLVPMIDSSGYVYSDHSRFLVHGISAIVLSEAFFIGDGNPYYHTSNDRIDKFNLPYFHSMSKLALATISTLAIEYANSNSEIYSINNGINILNSPNPFENRTTIYYTLPFNDNINISIYNVYGERVILLFDNFQNKGNYNINFNRSNLTTGIYFLVFNTSKGQKTFKMLID